MTTRQLYLIGYDISHPRRLSRVLRCVQRHTLGGQKSFYECWLSAAELHTLRAQLTYQIDTSEDSVIFIRLDARTTTITLGCAEQIASNDYFYID